MANTISRNSRYYNALWELRALITPEALFPKAYNEDKRCYYAIYDSESQSKISIVKVSTGIENNIREYFKANLYSTDEKKLFIENLMPFIESFGGYSIREMGMRHLDYKKKDSIGEKYNLKINGDFTEEIFLKELECYPLQIQENIKSLIKIRELLVESFNLFYKEILLQKQNEIQGNTLITAIPERDNIQNNINTPPKQIKDEIDIFLERVAKESIIKANANIDALAKSEQMQISTKDQRLAIYKNHLAIYQQKIANALYQVSDGGELYNIVNSALGRKRVYKDKLYRVWVECATNEEVYKEIELQLADNYTNYFIAFNLSAMVDNLTGKYDNWVPNEEFIKGKIREGFSPRPVPLFKITKGKEERKLTIDEYLDALLRNWENAIDEQKDFDNKLDALQNARLTFSALKYKYPVEKEIEKVFERLNEIEGYIKYHKDKKRGNKNKQEVGILKSYTWKGEYKALKTTYRKLKENLIIANETDINTFLYVFSGKPESAIKKPIQWIKSNRLLAYLLFVLYDNKKIANKDWQSIAGKGKFFSTAKGKPITANDLAKATSDCNKFEDKPENAEIIDTILKALITKQ